MGDREVEEEGEVPEPEWTQVAKVVDVELIRLRVIGEIQGHDGGAGRGFSLVKPPSYGLCDREESGGGGPDLPEAMLRFRDC